MKKLLIVTDTYLPRKEGITTFLLKIMPRLKEEYEVTVLAPDFGTEKSSGDMIRLPSYKFQVADLKPPKFSFWKVRKLVKSSDLVFVQSIAPLGASAIFNAFLARKKVVTYNHVIEWEVVTKAIKKKFLKKLFDFIIRIVSRCLYNRCSLIIVPSAEVAEILNANKIKTKKMIVHLGIDTNKFIPAENKAAAKGRIGISSDKKVITYVGRLAREKDLITLYRAFVRLQKKYPDTVLLIVGEGLKEIKDKLKRRDVIFIGAVDNVVPYLQAADIFVLPSLTETSSLATMEAMSCGIAVVVTPVGYVKDYVINGFNGFFFRKKDPYDLFKKLGRLIENEKIIKRLGINARKTIVENYPWDKTANGILKILRGV